MQLHEFGLLEDRSPALDLDRVRDHDQRNRHEHDDATDEREREPQLPAATARRTRSVGRRR
jgi:hypothetical protein